MKLSELSEKNVEAFLAEVGDFLDRCPEYTGDELQANLIYERVERQGQPFNADTLESTFHALQNEGLIDAGSDSSYQDLSQPVLDVRTDEPEDEEFVYTWEDDPQPTRADYEGLSTQELRSLIQKHEEQSSTPKSVDEEIGSLSTAQLGQLIVRLNK